MEEKKYNLDFKKKKRNQKNEVKHKKNVLQQNLKRKKHSNFILLVYQLLPRNIEHQHDIYLKWNKSFYCIRVFNF